MAELATLARPYAEALFQVAVKSDLQQVGAQVEALAAVTADPQLRQFADNPKVAPEQVIAIIDAVLQAPMGDIVRNLLGAVLANGRLTVLPAIAEQFHLLVNERTGVADAQVFSAFAIDAEQLAAVVLSLEKRFGRKLNASVQIEPDLIGGIRVVVGDEVLDTSVKARLEQMKVALAA
jgi:F-type H+-transporting ATPase subunit delta